VPIAKEFIVNLKGKEYPLFAGVLDAAHKAGLRSLTTQLIQIPSAENGMTAIVSARAEFEGGRVFEDVGDCSPASTSPMLAAASIRLASTRAKGRVLRDAVNVGQTLLEELPDMDAAPEPARGRQAAPQAQQQQSRTDTRTIPAPIAQSEAAANGMTCADCNKPLTKGQYDVSFRAYGHGLCPNHQKARVPAQRAEGRN
jgi:hypothetical protein